MPSSNEHVGMARNFQRIRKTRVGRIPNTPHVPKPSITPAANRAAAEAPSPGRAREISIALSLLKYFYWIELGIRSYLRVRSNVEFSRGEGLVIASVLLGYSRPSDIARQLGVSRQAIHVTIQQMKKKGIVDLSPDPHDGRIKQVVLTEVAQKMNEDGIVAMDLLWKELGNRLGQSNLARAAKVLRADWGPPVLFDSDESEGEWSPK